MAETQYIQYDFNLIPLLNAVLEANAGSLTPSSGNVGKVYRNTTAGTIEMVLNPTTILVLASTNTRLDQFAPPNTNLSVNGHKIISVTDPTVADDAATKNYVDTQIASIVNGLDWKNSARVAVTTNVNLAAPGATPDGVALSPGDRMVLAGQSTGTQNGLYIFNGAAAAATRAPDADSTAEVNAGMVVPIEEGSKADTLAILTTNNPITLGGTALAFTFVNVGTTYTGTGNINVTGTTISFTGQLPIANGGTGAATAAAARTALAVPRNGVVLAIPALTAGAEVTIAHGTGTGDAIAQARQVSNGKQVALSIRTKDATNVYVTSEVAVGSGTLELVYSPVNG